MKQFLSETDRSLLDSRIKEAEAKTGAQIVLATVKRSDSYVEIPWKAFAIGVSVSGFVVFIYDLFVLQWIMDNQTLMSLAVMLASGFLLVILTLTVPAFARLFLPHHRKETETMQYAESLFLAHELFATKGRCGILLLVSLFERQVVILPDTGVRNSLGETVIKEIISKMTGSLRSNDLKDALEKGLDGLLATLNTYVPDDDGKNELSNEIIEEEGQ
jgi:putative membrane protein